MSEPSVGSVSVDVVPSARRFPAQLARQVNPEAAKVGAEFGRLFGSAAQSEMAKGVRDGLSSGGRSSTEQGAKQGSDFGGAFARSLRARLEAGLRSLPKVEIDANSSSADKAIAGIRQKLEALQTKRVGIDIDAKTAAAEIRKIQEDLRDLTRGTKDVQIRADAVAASAELRKFQAEVAKVDGKRVDIQVDADTAGASAQLALMGSQARGSTSAFAGLLGAALLLGPALIPIGAVGAGAMAAILSGALAAAGGVGVLILALYPVIQAVQAVQAAHDKSAQSARGSTSAHLQMASAMDAVTSAQRGLASAREDARAAAIRADQQITQAERAVTAAEKDAARDRVEDARKIADAKRSLADVHRRTAQDQIDADRALVRAERDVADAQNAVLDAQKALNNAREKATRDAQDLANQVIDGQLDERQAILDVRDAHQELSATLADPSADEAQRAQAQLTYDRAIQRLREIQIENSRLAKSQEDAARAGVDGSEAVQSAQEHLIDAQRRLADAQQAQADAGQAQAQQQRDSARDIADAQRSVADAVAQSRERQTADAAKIADAHRRVADAVRDSADQQRRSADSIASAQQAVVSAQRGVQQASQSAGAAGGAALETMRQKLAALTPAGRDFVTFLTGSLFPALRPLGDAAQTAVLPGLQSALDGLIPKLPAVSGLITDFGTAVGDLAGEAVDALDDPVWVSFFEYLDSDGADTLTTVARIVGNFSKAFAGLAAAFKPVTDQVLGGLLTLSRRFADFSANAGPETGLGKFIQYMQDNGPLVAATLGSIATAVGHILASLSPLGPIVLAVVGGFANLITALPAPVIAGIVVGIGALALAVGAVNVAMTLLALNPVVLAIALIVAAIAGLAAAFVIAYQRSETFRNIVNGVFGAVRDFVFAAAGVVLGILGRIGSFLLTVLGPAFRLLYTVWIHPVWTAIQLAFALGAAAIQAAILVGTIAIKLLGAIFSELYSVTIKPIWEHGIRPVFQALGDFISNTVAPAFSRGVEAIARAWAGVQDAAKVPVRFVVDTVINKGIIGTFNKVADIFHVDPIEPVKLPPGFATGGFVSGPGGPREDKIPAMLSNGEFVINAASVKRIGLNFLDYINNGGSFGGDPGGVARFASGGAVQKRIQQTAAWIPSVDPDPYVWGAVGPNSFDCSGLAGEVWARVVDKARNTRYFTTSSNLEQFGFRRGTGTMTLGLDPGHHVVGNLAGMGFEARSTATGIFTGLSATPPGRMPQQWYLASLPGSDKGKGDGGIDWFSPVDSFKSLFDGILDVGDRFSANPFGRLVMGAPKALISGAGEFISDAVPGLKDGGLVKYDEGGYIPPGITSVLNATGKPEPVFTASQWANLRKSGDGSTPVQMDVTINNPVPEQPSESMSRTLRKVAMFGLVGK